MAVYIKLTQTNDDVNELKAIVGKPLLGTGNHKLLDDKPKAETISDLGGRLDIRYKADGLTDWENGAGGGNEVV